MNCHRMNHYLCFGVGHKIEVRHIITIILVLLINDGIDINRKLIIHELCRRMNHHLCFGVGHKERLIIHELCHRMNRHH